MRKLLASVAVAATLFASVAANAATITFAPFNVTVTSTGISCPLPASLPAPVAAGTVLCTFTVTPAGWSGVLSAPTGASDSARFVTVVSGSNTVLEVGATALTALGSAASSNTYNIGTVTSTP